MIEAHITPILPYQGEKGDIPAGVTTTIVALVNHLSETISDIGTVHKIASTLRIEARASLRSAWADVVWGLFYAGRLTELEPAVRQHIPTSGS